LQKAQSKAYFSTKNSILINNLHRDCRLPLTHVSVKETVSKVMDGEDCQIGEIVLNFVNDRAIRRINNEYLGHDFFTDIITFPYNDKRKNIEGEIFISLDTVRKNGKFYGTGFKMELKRVIIHGCLHLAGYMDATNRQKELIRNKENFYLS
jgi:rRNA maturation RNase YbeY